ncbi:hypothetical protein [Paractinoplanes durhamensis]|uniref:hypothetical protein n=1 Tax=Paractinoplanes durhamensis TaxID=113563 RepID=UPI001940E600|nr:hypothetical protein [Actinoplanes durhamensis]
MDRPVDRHRPHRYWLPHVPDWQPAEPEALPGRHLTAAVTTHRQIIHAHGTAPAR